MNKFFRIVSLVLTLLGIFPQPAGAVRWELRENVTVCTIQGACVGDQALVTVQGCAFVRGGEARVFNFLAYWDQAGEHRLSLPVIMLPSYLLDVGQGGAGFNIGWQNVQTGEETWFRIDRGTWTDAVPDSGAHLAGVSAVAKNGAAPNGTPAAWIDAVLTVSCK